MKQKAIIFGHTGQDGYYLRKLLEEKNIQVYGVARSSSNLHCSLTEYDSLVRTFKEVYPDYIFDFAAVSTTRHEALFENHQTIGLGGCNLLEAARLTCPNARIFLSGSGLQFVNHGEPIDETAKFSATSPYAVERNYTYYLAKYFRERFHLKVYFGFFFTHDSPLRSEQHMSKKIVLAARRAQAGSFQKLEIGDIGVRKEYLFAGDAVNAVWMMVNQEEIYEAVIGTGVDYSIEEWLDVCFRIAGLKWNDFVLIQNGFLPEYKRLISKPDRIRSLGWRPKVDFYALAKMMMEDVYDPSM